MDDLEEILRKNPRAAAGADGIKAAIEALGRLKAAGVGGGGYDLLPPFGGRAAFKETLKPQSKKAFRSVSKVTFRA